MFLLGFLNRSRLDDFSGWRREPVSVGFARRPLAHGLLCGILVSNFAGFGHRFHRTDAHRAFQPVAQWGWNFEPSTNAITPQGTAELVSGAHAANKQVLICIGGAGSYFPNAASTANVASFVSNLTNFMTSGGYDGIDVDWEPLPDGDGLLYTNLIFKLRAALDGFSTHKLLISAVPPSVSPGIVAAVQDKLDQTNVMTYDLSGPYAGWVTWFNSPIYDGGYVFPSVTNELVPSIEGSVNQFVTSGIPANKLGIGLAFYGYVWYGVSTEPTTVCGLRVRVGRLRQRTIPGRITRLCLQTFPRTSFIMTRLRRRHGSVLMGAAQKICSFLTMTRERARAR
jgi:Glycosyl hydrolases family 18